ncbi:hypothetical protein HFD88_008528 [Aspergillus terreus]|nr:hypothetical protein HFD88_008528 [Aspergillus terreus]
MSTPPQAEAQTNKITCEFAIPCTTTPTDPTTGLPDPPPRKVISHIFGRNKTATKRFPPHVWVHYCRKHYQRARYRAAKWPFIQCELLLDSLQRMEAWGGVRSFAVVLRKREIERLTPSLSLRGADPDPDPASDADAVSRSKKAATKSKPTGKAKTKAKANAKAKGKGKGKGKGKRKRKTPRIVAAPVPGWLRAELGPDKSFADVRALLRRVMGDLAVQQGRGRMDLVRFPDIEILPTFFEWVDEDQEDPSRHGEGEGEGDVSEVYESEGDDHDEDDESDVVSPRDMRARRMSRVSSKGGVRKI